MGAIKEASVVIQRDMRILGMCGEFGKRECEDESESCQLSLEVRLVRWQEEKSSPRPAST